MSTSTVRWRRLFAVMAVLVLIAATSGFNPMTASSGPAPVHKAMKATAQAPVGFAVSQPLRMLAEKANKAKIDAGPAPVEPNPYPVKAFLGGMQIPRQVVANRSVQSGRPQIEPKARLIDPPSPGLDAQWAGLSQGVNRVWYGYGVYPPDTQGDVGPSHYIQIVNIQVAVFDLTESSQVGTPKTLYAGPINALWEGSGLTACASSEDGDPVVVYDEYADRWVLSQFALTNYPNPPFYECIAVSQTGDPMGSWNLYQYAFPVMNDYPKFGVWHDGYYMTMNQFTPWVTTGSQWAGQGVVVFDKAAMQAGDPAARMVYVDTFAACTTGAEPECNLGGMLPADADGSTAPTGPEVFMQFDDDAWGYSPDQLQLWTLVPDWGAGTATFSHLTDLPTSAFDSEVCPNYSRNCIAQLGTTVGVDAITDRLMYRLQWRDFGTHQSMVVNHTVDVVNAPHSAKGQAGVRWYELRDTGAGWGIFQQGDVAPDTKNRWMGSAAMDDVGNISLGYSVSDATIYPGIRYTTHLVSDPAGTMRAEATMANGGGAQTGTGYRWGDYSMMSVLPAGAGGCDFIYTQEYLRGTTPAEWYTWIGYFHNTSCYTGDVTPPDTTITGTGSAGPGTTTAEFTFTGTDDVAVASFECALDGSAFAACTSPKAYTDLSSASHTFEVRAVDSSRNVDPTPATYTWTSGDLTPPDTTITGTGSAGPGSATAEFSFTGTDNVLVASFECALDGSAFAACTSPKGYIGLTNGPHTFQVRAVDSSGNVDATPATYTWTIALGSATFVSQAPYDGFVIESGENSNVGGTTNTMGSIVIGDNFSDRQFKGFLSFDTSSLPDGAVVISARLQMLEQDVVGTNPYSTHGPLLVDITNPYFGTSAALKASDFQAAATVTNTASCSSVPDAGWYHCDLTDGLATVSLVATTQFRLGFTMDDNDDHGADQIKFYSGNAGNATKRPVLVVTYYIP